LFRSLIRQKWTDLPLRRKGFVVVAFPIIALLGATVVIYQIDSQARAAEALIDNVAEVRATLQGMGASLAEAQVAVREYASNGKEESLARLKKANETLPKTLARLKASVESRPEQAARMQAAEVLLDSRLQDLNQMVALHKENKTQELADLVAKSTGNLRGLGRQLTAMFNTESMLLAERVKAKGHTRTRLNAVLATSVGIGILWAILAAMLFTSGISRRIHRLEENTRRLAKGQELQTPEPGRDEIGRLDAALHQMNWELSRRSAELARSESTVREKVRVLHLTNQQLEAANGELKNSSERLERSNRELQDFASVASHDLQEPLRKVQAFGDRLKTGSAHGLDEQGRDYLDRMLNATKRMRSLIQDLLTFSRVTSQGSPFVPVDLAQVTRDVLCDLEVRIAETNARVEVGDLPTIDADGLQMRQLLQNLIGNALKFHQDGKPPVVWVYAKKSDDDSLGDGMLRLIVRDQGIGFHEKYLDRIFMLFQRLHGRDEYEGTGIGLAICRKIAQRHGGEITAESIPGQGASFHVTFPFHSSNEKSPLVPAPGADMDFTILNPVSGHGSTFTAAEMEVR
jgi:signal transduction histidine kinase